MRALAALLVILASQATAEIPSPPSGGGGGGTAPSTGFDVTVDLDQVTNACAAIQAAISPFLDVTNTTTERRVRIIGDATVTWSDLHDLGPYRACVAMIPYDTGDANGYPADPLDADCNGTGKPCTISLSSGKRLTIDWDATLTWDPAGQTEAVCLVQRGNGYLSGYESGSSAAVAGAIQTGLVERGRLTTRTVQGRDVDSGWPAERQVDLNLLLLVNSSTSTIHHCNMGVQRSDLGAFYEMLGDAFTLSSSDETSDDNDDIGLLEFATWGSHLRGGYIARGLGTAHLLYMNNSKTVFGAYQTENNRGLVFGDSQITSMPSLYVSASSGFSTTSAGTEPSRIRFVGGVIEGNDYGLITEYLSQGVATFVGMHLEAGTLAADQILLGAGRCPQSGSNSRACSTDAQCPGNSGADTCSVNNSVEHGTFLFLGGTLPSDRGDTLYSGLRVNAQGGELIARADLGDQTATGSDSLLFEVGENSPTMTVNLDGSRMRSAGAVFPDYAYVTSGFARRHWFQTHGTASVSQCLRRDEGNAASCTANQAHKVFSLVDDGPVLVSRLECIVGDVNNGWDAGDSISLGVVEYDPSTGTSSQIGTETVTFTTPAAGSIASARIGHMTSLAQAGIGVDLRALTDTNVAIGHRLGCFVETIPLPKNAAGSF